MLQTKGQNHRFFHKWAGWLYTPYRLGFRNALQRRTKSEVAHK